MHDLTRAADLLHSEEEVVDAKAWYLSIAKRPERAVSSVNYRIAMRPAKAALYQAHWMVNYET